MILYNGKLKERAQDLRKAENLCETILWKKINKRQLLGKIFIRQKIIGQFIADFYCHEMKLVIEIDGNSHDDKIEYDNERDEFMKSLGLQVLRISVHDVLNNLESVLRLIESKLSTESGA